MDAKMNMSLGPVERVRGPRALFAYLIGCALGTAISVPILTAVFGGPAIPSV